MLNAGVLSFGVFSDKHSVDIVIWSLEAFDTLAGSHVGKKIERSSKSQVERNMTLTNWRRQGSFQSNGVFADVGDSIFRNSCLAIFENRCD